MTREEALLLTPGTKIMIGPKLLGEELYGWDDPQELTEFLGTVVTVKKVDDHTNENVVYIGFEECNDSYEFINEEVLYVLPDQELEESDIDLGVLLGL